MCVVEDGTQGLVLGKSSTIELHFSPTDIPLRWMSFRETKASLPLTNKQIPLNLRGLRMEHVCPLEREGGERNECL